MAAYTRRRSSAQTADIWPGFVDALSTLLMVIIFLLTVFVLAQFFLTEQLAGRDEALKRLETQVAELADVLALEHQSGAELRASVADLSAQLQSSTAARDKLGGDVARLTADLQSSRAEAGNLRERAATLEAEIARERRRLAENQGQLTEEQRLSAARKSEVDRLSQSIASLRHELQRLNAALEASEAKSKAQNAEIVNLSSRLNAALASKVEELARYRSEFFGKLREVLGNRRDIRIVGDRFVFQSEVLFGSGDARLGSAGKAEIQSLARTLIDLSKKIPPNIEWVLRVDGHTDVRPIRTQEFPSNWELSTARALAVVRQLVADGLPPERLAPTGFGPYQPMDNGNTEAAYARNRRIEFKLTER